MGEEEEGEGEGGWLSEVYREGEEEIGSEDED